MNEKIDQEVIQALEELNAFFAEQKFTNRLIMTDDLMALGEIRRRAKEKIAVGDKQFYYGCSLPQRIQDIVDTLVRRHKVSLRAIINDLNDEERTALGLTVTDDPAIKCHLFILTASGMGFYVSRRSNVSRDQRQPHVPAIDLLKKRMEQNDDYRRARADHPNRRQFVNLASIHK